MGSVLEHEQKAKIRGRSDGLSAVCFLPSLSDYGYNKVQIYNRSILQFLRVIPSHSNDDKRISKPL